MYTCKKCNTKIESHWKLCPECGTPVKREQEPSKSEESLDKTVKRASEIYGAVRLDNLPTGYLIDDRYEIQQKLGQGGFGAVYLVYDRKMHSNKALKVIPDEVANDRESMEQLRHEARVMLRLNHPNIVRVYDFHDEGHIKYIDMEYVEGKTLTDVKLDNVDKKIPEEEVVRYAIQVAEALDYAHKKNILHKDLKPQNVMVTTDGEVKVMDFGIAEVVRSSMTRLKQSSSSGTLEYMSPEQLRGKEVGKESDIYSFGAMLYDLLSGRPPFYRGDIQYQILNEKPEMIDGVSDWINDILQKCLEKDYVNRYIDFNEFLEILRFGLIPKDNAQKPREKETSIAEDSSDSHDTTIFKNKKQIQRNMITIISLIPFIGIAIVVLLLYLFIFHAGKDKTHIVSGVVTDAGVGVASVDITTSGGDSQRVKTNSRGEYTIIDVPQGIDITIKPTREGYKFEPPFLKINNFSESITGLNFAAVKQIFSVTGRITKEGLGLGGVRINASGGYSQSVTTNSSGEYTITGVPYGEDISLTPSLDGHHFTPSSQSITFITKNKTNFNFSTITTEQQITTGAPKEQQLADTKHEPSEPDAADLLSTRERFQFPRPVEEQHQRELNVDVSYALEWHGAVTRRKVSGDLPEYPKGATTAEVVRLRAVVLPNGTVKSVQPARRNNNVFETVAISALNGWRFEKLAVDVPQVEHEFYISFHFSIE